jgi:hypothetical protein
MHSRAEIQMGQWGDCGVDRGQAFESSESVTSRHPKPHYLNSTHSINMFHVVVRVPSFHMAIQTHIWKTKHKTTRCIITSYNDGNDGGTSNVPVLVPDMYR